MISYKKSINILKKSKIIIKDEIIKSKKAIYNLNVDKSVSKIGNGNELKKFDPSKLPNYIQKNKNQFKEWMED